MQTVSVFEHLTQQFFESQHLAITLPSLTSDVVEPHPLLLEQLAMEAANVPFEENTVDICCHQRGHLLNGESGHAKWATV